MIFFQGFDGPLPGTFFERPNTDSRWWQLKDFLFSSLPGEMIQFHEYFSNGLKPPTRDDILPVLTGRPRFWYHPGNDENLRWAFHGASYRSWGTGRTAPGLIFSLQKFHTLKNGPKNGFLPPRSARCWGGRKKDIFPSHQYWWRFWTCYWYFCGFWVDNFSIDFLHYYYFLNMQLFEV